MQNSNNTLVIVAGLLLALVLGGVFALVWHGSVTGPVALAFVAPIVTALIAIFAVHQGTKSGGEAMARGFTAQKP